MDLDFKEAEKHANELFKGGKIIDAIAAYRKMIEGGYKVNFQIQGLGNSDHMISRYEWFVYRWYNQQQTKGKMIGNAFDSLSLCYCMIRITHAEEAEQGILWYQRMLKQRNCYQLQVGYANILYNKARFDESIKVYNKILQKRPFFMNAYVSIAMVYQYRRIQIGKANAMAEKILTINSDNCYAHYILARNKKDVNSKIQSLKEVFTKFPDYVRVANDIGIAYGTKAQHQSAIVWYKKCLQLAPEYAAAYNNVGVRTEMLKQYNQALPWYFKACQLDHQYKAAHKNASDIFDHLKWTDIQIIEQMEKYQKLDRFMFYYYLGLGYYDKKKNDAAINWYTKAYSMNPKNFQLMNSLGIAYDEIKDYKNAEKYYLKCIELNPKYHMAYYNIGILCKAQNKIDDAIHWYKKALEVNPRYNKPYNNLANIYKDRKEYQKAINYYIKAIQANSTYTLAVVNMAVCYLNLQMYQEAFIAFERGKQILPNDNNNLSEGNKKFLKQSLDKFDNEGQTWRKTGLIGLKQKQQLSSLIKSFQFSRGSKDEKSLRPQILEIIKLIHEDKFELYKIDKIFLLIKLIFQDDEEYFHILPQMFIQYFINESIKKKRPVLQIQFKLSTIVKKLSKIQQKSQEQLQKPQLKLPIDLYNFKGPAKFNGNLFNQIVYFKSYEQLYKQIDKVNRIAEKSLPQFAEFVQNVRLKSNGVLYGVNLKLTNKIDSKFNIILKILYKIFEKELDEERLKRIIQKIDGQTKFNEEKPIKCVKIVDQIADIWTKQINLILADRYRNKIETKFEISDLLHGKVIYNNVEDLSHAIQACDILCKAKGYQIIQIDNRIDKTMDVIVKMRINESICQFQLAISQTEGKLRLIDYIYEIQRSPLGCIFGSYLFMSKEFSYPIVVNCKDIKARFKSSSNKQDQQIVYAAEYIINTIEKN